MGLDLRTARFLRGVTQLQIEKDLGIAQSKISTHERGIKRLTQKDKEKLRGYLALNVDFDHQQSTNLETLSESQKELCKIVLNFLSAKDEVSTAKWASGFKTAQAFYDSCKRIVDEQVVMISFPSPRLNDQGEIVYDS